ncbi:MAG: C4-dicarboxylic acid transporter DauA [Myxococcaceae bacterium]
MKRRYQAALKSLPKLQFRPATALREVLKEGYRRRDFVRDLQAGVVVGIVALPLAMALAIGAGVPPQHGLYTAIVAGAAIALLGGSRTQVSGPTAAFIAILAPISAKYGIGGLLLSTAMAGAILIAMGAMRLGRLIQFIPHPVTTGFTTGIAVVIATGQVDKLLGLSGKFSDEWTERVWQLIERSPGIRWADLAMGAATLAVLIFFPRVTRRVPAPLVAMVLAGIAAAVLERFGITVTTLASKFDWHLSGQSGHGIPPFPPLPSWPWNHPGADGQPLTLSAATLGTLASSAFAIAMLGAIESLLSAVVSDGMAGTKHDPDAELLAQGVGNLLAPFFGGIAATGAIARTATNIRSGAKSPVAATVHSVFVLLAVLVLAPLLGYLPMPSMAALLLLVAWNMAEVKHFRHILQVAPNSDVLVLLICFGLTVMADMVKSVSVGVMLAALLFMRRMADLTQARMLEGEHHRRPKGLPKAVLFYEIAGPLFFGAAQKAIATLSSVAKESQVVLLDLSAVPAMDMTGLVALETSLATLRKAAGTKVVFAGVQPQPLEVLERAGLVNDEKSLFVRKSFDEAVKLACELAGPGPVMTPPGDATPVAEQPKPATAH